MTIRVSNRQEGTDAGGPLTHLYGRLGLILNWHVSSARPETVSRAYLSGRCLHVIPSVSLARGIQDLAHSGRVGREHRGEGVVALIRQQRANGPGMLCRCTRPKRDYMRKRAAG
jgi:hypothetical protein